MREHQETAKGKSPELGVNAPFAIQSRFDDFDQFAESVQAWNLDFRLLDRNRFQARLLQFGSAEVQMGRARFDNHLHQQGDPPRGMRTIVLPADESQDFIWRGQRITGRSLMVFPERAELESLSRPGFGVYTYSVTSDRFERLAGALELPPPDKLLEGVDVVELTPESMRVLRRRASEICGVVAAVPRSITSAALQSELRSRFPNQILLTLAAARGIEERSSAVQKGKAIRGALKHMAEHLGEQISVADLCRAAGVSERTLRRAFQEKFDVSPKGYLADLRLCGVHDELRAAGKSDSRITDIANRWGFWHMGQFAADYRRQFGELPSDTLRRR